MKDRKNFKPVRDPLFIPEATRHMMMKRHFFLVTMFLQVPWFGLLQFCLELLPIYYLILGGLFR